jgi:hypothetical protein
MYSFNPEFPNQWVMTPMGVTNRIPEGWKKFSDLKEK